MAILWISGNSGSGKTTLAKALAGDHNEAAVTILDGDVIRNAEDNKDFSEEGRYKHCLKVAEEAKRLSFDGHTVIVAVIAPYKKLRESIQEICGCTFIYLPGGKEPDKKYPYEWPSDKAITAFRLYI